MVILCDTLGNRYKFERPTASRFIDFRAEFDLADHEVLRKVILGDGVPSKLFRPIKSYYARVRACPF